MPKTSIFVPAAAVFFVTSALAHQTFLQPKNFEWAVGDKVEIAMTSALSYPDFLSGPSPSRIADASVTIAGMGVDDFSYEENETFLNIAFEAEREGMAVVALSSKVRAGEIEPKDAEMYLDEIGADDAVRQAFLDLPGDPPLQRSYRKHTKTFFCVGNCRADDEATSKPVGQALEFVAVPSSKREFRLLWEGEPLAHHDVLAVASDSTSVKMKSGSNGLVRVDASMSGPVMMMAVWITLPSEPAGTYHSDYATLTVHLDPPNPRDGK